MTLLPILDRELRVAARRRGTYWSRGVIALIASLLMGFLFFETAGEPAATVGQTLFRSLGLVVFVFCVCIGVSLTFDCLSEEKREGTLGLLFLTDLKGKDVVFGKLAASSVNALYGVMAIMPILGITLVLGGVSGFEFARVSLVLLNTLFFSLSMGLFASALCRDSRQAMGLAGLIVFLLTALFPICAAIVLGNVGASFQDPFTAADPRALLAWLLLLPSPCFNGILAIDQCYKRAEIWYWVSLGLIHFLSWLCLAIACFALPRRWQERPIQKAAAGWRARWHAFYWGSPEWKLQFRRRILAINPFYWLVAREKWKPALVRGFFLAIGILWTWGAIHHGRYWLDPVNYIFTALTIGAVYKTWIAGEVSYRFAADMQSGAMELLLTTPLKAGELFRGQCLALGRQFLGPLIVLVIVDLIFLWAGRYSNAGHLWAMTILMGIFILALDICAIIPLGMWLGLHYRRSTRAFERTTVLILVLPWILYGILIPILNGATWLLGIILSHYSATFVMGSNLQFWDPDDTERLWIWFAISVVIDLFFIHRSVNGLTRHFRSIASGQRAK